MAKTNRACAIAALIIAGIVIIVEIPWLPKSQLAMVILSLAIATGLNAIATIRNIRKDD